MHEADRQTDPGKDLQAGMLILDQRGAIAEVIAIDHGGTESFAVARLPDGVRIAFPVSLLDRKGTTATFAGRFDELVAGTTATAAGAASEGGSDASSATRVIVPVIQEQLTVNKRQVDTGGGLRIEKKIDQRDELIDLPLMRDELVVEHVPRDVLLAEGEMPTQREEGDTLILPVLEEVLIVQKRLRLREEIHITRRRHETRDPQHRVLRTEHVSVERFDENASR